jgi:hypothetical protein
LGVVWAVVVEGRAVAYGPKVVQPFNGVHVFRRELCSVPNGKFIEEGGRDGVYSAGKGVIEDDECDGAVVIA